MPNLLPRIAALPPAYLALWGLLAVLTVGLLLMMRTEWGRRRPTPRYVLVSLVGHLLLICLATTIRFLAAPFGEPASAPVRVRIVMAQATTAAQPEPDPDAEATPLAASDPSVNERQDAESTPPLNPTAAAEPPPETAAPAAPLSPPPEPNEHRLADAPLETTPVASTPLEASPPAANTPSPTVEPEPETPVPQDSVAVAAAPSAAATPEPAQSAAEANPIQANPIAPVTPSPMEPIDPPLPLHDSPPPAVAGDWRSGQTEPVAVAPAPTAYPSRTLEERWRLAERDGGSRFTEDAVDAGLAWLAAAQSNDGRWDADRWSAGRERRVLGEDRRSAGIRADTGVSGLAALAFMGAGHKHTDETPSGETLRSGLEFLLRSQADDGGLAGDATRFARTYCHSMATFALAEALAHTRDERLRRAVAAAVDHLVAGQHQPTGGWRYQPGQPGDMSQMGWVIMALRSAELGGVAVPPATWAGIERFVDSARRGDHGGLACYRRDGPASRTMTAEALYCRQILGVAIPPRSGDEAIAALIGSPPGAWRPNLYYWYYGALALHHHRHTNGYADTAWRVWNQAMTRALIDSQVRDGVGAGSWSPNTLWGGYGGRVYATAMAVMCLEVYYRYDPQELVRDPWIAARPGAGTLR